MNFFEVIRVALRALLRNRLRSFLTTLGIIIGVAAVIAMVSIGEGAKSMVAASFAAMGTNLFIIMPGTSSSSGVMGGFGSLPTVTWDDLEAIKSELPHVKSAAPGLRSTAQIMVGDQNWSTSVWGVTPEYFEVRNWNIRLGSFFNKSDVEGGNKLVILGQTVVDHLFGPDANPIGQRVRIKNIPFDIVGVTASKGQSPMGTDYDDVAFIPSSTFQAKIQGGLQNVINGTVFATATSEASMKDAEREIRELLRERHRLREDEDDDFSMRNLSEIANAQQDSTKTISLLLACVAAVSLVIGGIGIMNIMLVSVTERTREIGIRMAVGAKPAAILSQFLTEAMTLSLLGGLLGMILGVSTAIKLSSSFGWPLLIRTDVTAMAIASSAIVGVVFGLYPAWKASRLDPIQALRFE